MDCFASGSQLRLSVPEDEGAPRVIARSEATKQSIQRFPRKGRRPLASEPFCCGVVLALSTLHKITAKPPKLGYWYFDSSVGAGLTAQRRRRERPDPVEGVGRGNTPPRIRNQNTDIFLPDARSRLMIEGYGTGEGPGSNTGENL
jgi:hypothetical protein